MLRSLRRLTLLAAAASAATAQPAPHRTGQLVERTVRSAEYARARRYWIYTSPDYDPAASQPAALLVAFDGGEWIDMRHPAMLDSLRAAGRTPPLVAVLVDDSSYAARLDDLANRAKFARFVVSELLPAVRKEWRVTTDPHRTIVAGESAGGLAAAYLALLHPEVFGNVLSQSGAFWRGAEASNDPPYEWLAGRYAAAPKTDVRFVLDVGTAETVRVLGGAGPVFIDATRRFRDVLLAKGYDVQYTEIPHGVHAPDTWRPRTPVDIVALTSRWSH
jgi:enterochelin esterase-like enzyme